MLTSIADLIRGSIRSFFNPALHPITNWYVWVAVAALAVTMFVLDRY